MVPPQTGTGSEDDGIALAGHDLFKGNRRSVGRRLAIIPQVFEADKFEERAVIGRQAHGRISGTLESHEGFRRWQEFDQPRHAVIEEPVKLRQIGADPGAAMNDQLQVRQQFGQAPPPAQLPAAGEQQDDPGGHTGNRTDGAVSEQQPGHRIQL